MVTQTGAGRVERNVAAPNNSFNRVASILNKDDTEPGKCANIKVVVRVRPENTQEREGGYPVVVRVLDDHMMIFDPKDEGSPDYYQGKRRRGRDITKRKKKDLRFAFDHIYGEGSTNEAVYQNSTRCIVDTLLDGYNCSVFAYGATGAGKTFTMLGNFNSPGVIFHTMMDLYQRIDVLKETKTCDVAVSYLEVYNEQIRDLLVPSGYLPLREDPQKGVVVAGLSLHKPRSHKELLHMLEYGNRNRTQHPTDANAESSRSHAVFQVFVRQRDRTANISADVRVAKLSLIDLAGSERATVTKNRGARFREGANINRSLLALGNCINALADGKNKGYVPYRNSKLTRLLKDSLGGNCRTVMIAAVSPSSMTLEDSYNTLKYADRAKNIKASLKRNVVSVDFHVSKYIKIIEDLRLEVTELQVKNRLYEEGSGPVGQCPPQATLIGSPSSPEVNRLKGELCRVFEERHSIRREVMELEGNERDLLLKNHFKAKCISRVAVVFNDQALCAEVTSRIEQRITAAVKRREGIVRRKEAIQKRMDRNCDWLQRVESEMKLTGSEDVTPEVLEDRLHSHHLQVELQDTKRQVKFLKKFNRSQQRHASSNEKLIAELLQTVRHQFFVIKGHGVATSDMVSRFEGIQKMVDGCREVAWADQSVVESMDTSGGDGGDAKFDINQLLEFPVLALANPQALKTPGRVSATMTPARVPGSRVKGAFTPGSGRSRQRHSNPRSYPITPRLSRDAVTLSASPSLTGTPEMQSTSESIREEYPVLAQERQRLSDRFESMNLHATETGCASLRENQHTASKTEPSGDGIIAAVKPLPEASGCPSDQMGARPGSDCLDHQCPHGVSSSTCQACQTLRERPTHTSHHHQQQLRDPEQTCSMMDISPNNMANDGSQRRPHTQPGVVLWTSQTHDNRLPVTSSAAEETARGRPPSVCTPPQHQLHLPLTHQQQQQTGTATKSGPDFNSTFDATPHHAHPLTVNSSTVTKANLEVAHGHRPPATSSTVTNPQHRNATPCHVHPPATNSSTVTKPVSSQAGDPHRSISSTQGQAPGPAQGGTVTKQKPEVVGKENNVVRSMDFTGVNCPTPAGKMTFAEALKSPGNALLAWKTQESGSPFSPRSPLMCRDNFENQLPNEQKPRRVTFAPSDDVAHHAQSCQQGPKHRSLSRQRSVSVTDVHTQQSLRRLGLPSTTDIQNNGSQRGGGGHHGHARGPPPPNYMQTTSSVNIRNKAHKRSLSSTGTSDRSRTQIPSAKRVALDENRPPVPRARRVVSGQSRTLPRSKSSGILNNQQTLHQRGMVF